MAYNKEIRRCDECNMVFEPEARYELQPVCPYCVLLARDSKMPVLIPITQSNAINGISYHPLFPTKSDLQQLYDGMWHAKARRIKLRACSG
jgi:hypothetical protein